MKKIAIVMMALLLGMGGVFAQKKAVNVALKSISNGKLDQGVENIEMAITNPETMSLSNTWMVYGDLYTAVAANPMFSGRYEGAADKALAGYKKALELEPSEKMMTMLGLKLPTLADVYYDMGTVAFSEKKDYAAATQCYEKSFEIGMMIGKPDSASMFNIALSAAYNKQYEKAAQYYGALVEGAYPMIGLYTGLADVYTQLNRQSEVWPLMEKLLERFANDSTAYIAAVGVMLNQGDNEHAEVVLSKAIQKWPTDPFLYLAMGVAYENSKQADKAEAAYKKALELNPDYHEAIYNMGAFYVNQGIELQNKANNLPIDATAEYDALKKKANDLFEQSVPFLEKIVAAQPNNVDALNTLRGIYVQLNKMDKAGEIKARIDALTPAE